MSIGVSTACQNTAGKTSVRTDQDGGSSLTVTAGSTIYVGACCDGTFAASGEIVDNQSNSFSLTTPGDITHGSRHSRVWVAENVAGGSGYFATVTAAASGFFCAIVVEVKGVVAAPATLAAGVPDASSPFDSGNISPAAQCDLVAFFFSGSFGTTETNTYNSGAMTIVASQLNADNGIPGSAAVLANQPTGTYSASVTMTNGIGASPAVFITSTEIITVFPATRINFRGHFGRHNTRTRYAMRESARVGRFFVPSLAERMKYSAAA